MEALGWLALALGPALTGWAIVRKAAFRARARRWVGSMPDLRTLVTVRARNARLRTRRLLRRWQNRVWNRCQIVKRWLFGTPRHFRESLHVSVSATSSVSATLTRAEPTTESLEVRLDRIEDFLSESQQETAESGLMLIFGLVFTVVGTILLAFGG